MLLLPVIRFLSSIHAYIDTNISMYTTKWLAPRHGSRRHNPHQQRPFRNVKTLRFTIIIFSFIFIFRLCGSIFFPSWTNNQRRRKPKSNIHIICLLAFVGPPYNLPPIKTQPHRSECIGERPTEFFHIKNNDNQQWKLPIGLSSRGRLCRERRWASATRSLTQLTHSLTHSISLSGLSCVFWHKRATHNVLHCSEDGRTTASAPNQAKSLKVDSTNHQLLIPDTCYKTHRFILCVLFYCTLYPCGPRAERDQTEE